MRGKNGKTGSNSNNLDFSTIDETIVSNAHVEENEENEENETPSKN